MLKQEELVDLFKPENAQRMMNEALDPELAAYFESSGGKTGWPMIRHPLVYEVPYTGLAGIANRRLAAKREAVKQALAEGNLNTAIWMHERPWRLWAFLNCAVGINPDESEPHECPTLWSMDVEHQQIALSVWMDSENIHSYQPWWEALFSPYSDERKPGQVLCDDPGLEAFKRLPREFTVYRGGDPSGDSFLSWTTDRKIAEFFARRGVSGNEKPRKIMSRTLNKSQVFAVMFGRGESEILALPE